MSGAEFLLVFSKNLKFYLERYEMSQADLAKRLGVSTTSVSNWVQGLKAPRMDKVDTMCDLFNCSRSDLMEERSKSGYYLDQETAEIAQRIKDSSELAALFDVQKDMNAEDLQTVYQLALALKRKEGR